MLHLFMHTKRFMLPILTAATVCPVSLAFAGESRIDYLSLSQGAVPVASGGAAEVLKVGTDLALRATGKSRSGDIPSSIVLTVTADGVITGIRSSNGAPF